MTTNRQREVLVVVGTRPEAIKLAPVVLAMSQRGPLRPLLVCTGQHRDLVEPALASFGLAPDRDLRIGRAGQALPDLTAATLTAMARLLDSGAVSRPAAVLVQGDTTTSVAAAMAGFYAGLPVAHVEAGLRSGARRNPFPEEVNRRLTAVLADLHLAPTDAARDNLKRAGVAEADIVVTGNTVIDALLLTSGRLASGHPATGRWARLDSSLESVVGPGRMVLVTMHRRESWGEPMRAALRGVARVARLRPDVRFVLPMHPNPLVRAVIAPVVRDLPNVAAIEPVDYPSLVALLHRATLVLTDSGGLQEEAPTLGKPVLVLRETTERPEGVAAGVARLVGTDPATIESETLRLLDDPICHARMARAVNPYGDGRAAWRCLAALEFRLGLRAAPPRPFRARTAPVGPPVEPGADARAGVPAPVAPELSTAAG